MAKQERRPRQRQRKRAAPIAPTPPKALVVLVGLPPATVGEAASRIESEFGCPVRVIPIAASQDDNDPYRNAQVATILNNVVGFARRKSRAEEQPAPSNIFLVYVPSPTQEPMLAAFDFFVFPVALATLGTFENGKQLRHDAAKVKLAIDDALAPTSQAMTSFQVVNASVGAVRHAEALQMPPGNFHTADDEPISTLFRSLRRGERGWDTANDNMTAEEYDKARIPHLRKGVRKRAYRDVRGLVFLRADLLALHGPPRELAPEDGTADELLLLRGSYRFGCPLLAGFHHDVQLENDSALDEIVFTCPQKGRVKSADVYVNIYPNDVVRGRKLTAL